MGKYQSASQQLIQEAETEQYLQEKATMLSIGKLAFLATVEFDELSNEEIHDTVEEEIDDKLDIVLTCNEVVEAFQAVLREKGGGPSLLDGRVKVVVDTTAAGLRVQNKLALEEDL
ncbi:hypothetical protein BC937DRAFT_92974 [Endogone sp. FLAS-F59071]|nr:hypothetical protein BC937DRAFT_92974 [Endogone sp. FLAS-F59071]|eukprot:RUS15043.1 hypothetical protein BC937DRAFT_92974 [Endogone sp. FLAS-F59071]